ncbi:isopentenyl-diphosphate Delta-isomerase [Actinotalea sp. BY-33]|uniref:Isopentenyl-diphosphate Delta-isomerase n=1 Tax=Actinotalea soli TaxID=2819234 RepID=A0A939LX47_9CELL|nr:isopentenyl-diphosphate Delta-isomerase [Actinotalea soli]MBO1752867.1 isopentenyl-diphosphate Delta-isomerase [Actinotalea soli]
MPPTTETVVLLDDDGARIGTADKASVHTADTHLHLAFSCHVIDGEGRLLMTRRALSKKTWPGVWTNSVCGHPGPDESFEDAIRRRAEFELGLTVTDVELVLPDFRYRAVDASGIVENEICPVYTARTGGAPLPNPDEVMDVAWIRPEDLHHVVAVAHWALSPWLVEHAADLSLAMLAGEPAGPTAGRP